MKLFFICSGYILTKLFWNIFLILLTTMCFRVSLCFDVLFFFNIQKSKFNEYFIINLLLLLAKFHIYRSKFTHQNPLFIVLTRAVQQSIQTISLSKNLRTLKNLFQLFNLFFYFFI